MERESIFCQYSKKDEFTDRNNSFDEEALDVIIPIINTNELLKKICIQFKEKSPLIDYS